MAGSGKTFPAAQGPGPGACEETVRGGSSLNLSEAKSELGDGVQNTVQGNLKRENKVGVCFVEI